MQTQEIPEQLWEAFLDDFSRVHLGQRVRLWVSGPSTALLREAVDLPLVGIDIDRSAEKFGST